jgi:S1-C subfamily serine protease
VDPGSGEVVIPEDEQAWLFLYGEKNLWSKLETKQDVDAQGVSHGVIIRGLPESGTPLAASHGVGQGDIIRSINGEPMTSKEDIAIYLRGKGKGLTRYEVVIESGGKSRTVVYRVPRRR